MTAALRRLLLILAMLVLGIGQAPAEVTYNRGNSADPKSLDPHKTSTVYEGASPARPVPGPGHQMPKPTSPGAAESWTISPDGKVYTFKLRPGATWSNGDPVTADDFVYSFRRLENPPRRRNTPRCSMSIKNAKEVNTDKAKPETLGVKAVDPNTFEMTLKAPTPYFLEMLTHQATYPVNQASIEKLGADWVKPGNLVSNGAYHARRIRAQRPHQARQEPEIPRRRERPDRRRQLHPDRGPLDRDQALRGGRARFQRRHADRAARRPRAKFGDQVQIGPYLGTYYYAFKTDKEPWGEPEAAPRHLAWPSTASSWPRRCGRTA